MIIDSGTWMIIDPGCHFGRKAKVTGCVISRVIDSGDCGIIGLIDSGSWNLDHREIEAHMEHQNSFLK